MLEDNRYTFSSQVVRMLILRHLVSSCLGEIFQFVVPLEGYSLFFAVVSPKNVLFKDPLEFLLFCLPLLKQRAIEVFVSIFKCTC